MKAAIYARVSTSDQTCENQLHELRQFAQARGWTGVEYIDAGVSGSKEHRPALNQLLADAKRRRFDVLVCWRLDRLGRSLKHLAAAVLGVSHAAVHRARAVSKTPRIGLTDCA